MEDSEVNARPEAKPLPCPFLRDEVRAALATVRA